jgi:hypothetical protein
MTQVTSFAMAGGLNLVTAPGATKPGELLYVENFICSQNGGYQRIGGYERFDGQPAPSGSVDAGVIAARRAAIQAVPGEGPIRGVWVYKGVVYAFRNAVGGASCVMWASSGAGWVSKKTGLTPDGTYRFVNFNFKGSASSAMMYGCSGVHKAFQWNGATWTDITTDMATDTPRFIEAHKNYLWLGFANGSLQNSSLGDPTGAWTPRTGANDIGLGDEITNIVSHKGVLVSYASNSIHILSGSADIGADGWSLNTYTRDGGALADCARVIGGDVLAWDLQGATYLQAAQVFGDFAATSLSNKIKPLANKVTPLFALVSKQSGTYRLFANDGRVLCATLAGNALAGWGQIKYDRTFTCGCVGEDASGNEVIFAGDGGGYVYQLDSGPSFDGANIVGILRTAFNTLGAPTRKKRWRRLVIELSASSGPVALRVMPDFNFGDFGGSATGMDFDMWASGGGGLFDGADWDGFVFDAGTVGQANVNLSGVATSMGLLFNHISATDAPFVLAAAHVHYDVWGMQR